MTIVAKALTFVALLGFAVLNAHALLIKHVESNSLYGNYAQTVVTLNDVEEEVKGFLAFKLELPTANSEEYTDAKCHLYFPDAPSGSQSDAFDVTSGTDAEDVAVLLSRMLIPGDMPSSDFQLACSYKTPSFYTESKSYTATIEVSSYSGKNAVKYYAPYYPAEPIAEHLISYLGTSPNSSVPTQVVVSSPDKPLLIKNMVISPASHYYSLTSQFTFALAGPVEHKCEITVDDVVHQVVATLSHIDVVKVDLTQLNLTPAIFYQIVCPTIYARNANTPNGYILGALAINDKQATQTFPFLTDVQASSASPSDDVAVRRQVEFNTLVNTLTYN